MAFIFMDESGDLGFNFDKKGTSQYFLITFLFASNKRPVEKCVRRVHIGLRQKYRKKIGVLHAYAEEAITRRRLLSCLSEKDLSVMAILLNKRKVYTRLQNEKPVLYNYVTNILLDRVFSRSILKNADPVKIIASRKDTSKFLNDNFKTYLRSQLTENHNAKISVAIHTPAEQKALQAVDFISWSIFRKYEFGDTEYYNIIRRKIAEEKPLFP